MGEAHYAQSEKDTWQTPDEILDILTNHVTIDLDPCAGEDTNIGMENIAPPEDGLACMWWGTVFVNPPFSEKELWVDKAVEEYMRGHIERAIILTPDSTDVQSWWHGSLGDCRGMVEYCDTLWFSEGRINYVDPDTGKQENNPTFGTALNFMGHFPMALFDELSKEGDMLHRHPPQ